MYGIWRGKERERKRGGEREADSVQPHIRVPSKLDSESWPSPLSVPYFRRGIDKRPKDSLRPTQRVILPHFHLSPSLCGGLEGQRCHPHRTFSFSCHGSFSPRNPSLHMACFDRCGSVPPISSILEVLQKEEPFTLHQETT